MMEAAEGMSVKELKCELGQRGLSGHGLSEKHELVTLLKANWERPRTSRAEPAPPPQSWGSRCPFATATGYSTTAGREDWIKSKPHLAGHEPASSLLASPDATRPLYFWQLHSVLGTECIVNFVRNFYGRVLADKTPGSIAWAFTRIAGLDHHVATQAAFWVDQFGGGKKYHGADYRLNFHHENNAAAVMTAEGARRWMKHMGEAILEETAHWNQMDVRIKPCVVDFLRVKIKKYAAAERATKYDGWRFDEADFDFVARDRDFIALHRAASRARTRAEEPDETVAGYATLAPEDKLKLNLALARSPQDLRDFSAKDLKLWLKHHKVDAARIAKCLEKAELLSLALEALANVQTGAGSSAPRP